MNRKSKGFTLVETIVAVAILAVVTVPIIGIFIQTAKIDSKSRQIQKATDLAQNMMESIREYTMEEIIDQCMNVETKGLNFMVDWCENYTPSKYKFSNVEDDGEIFEGIEEDYVWGNVSSDNIEETVYVDIKGGAIRFAFTGVKYNSSVFDAIISFSSKEGLKRDKYYLYDVTISIYQTAHESHTKLAKITGAVQNK